MNKTLITEAELAEMLSISKSTLHKLRESGDIPYQMIGSCIRYSQEDIDVWMKEKRHNTTPERN